MASPTVWNSSFNLSADSAGRQGMPVLKALHDGSFVALWLGETTIFMRLFNADGTAKSSGAPITLAEGDSFKFEPAVAVLTNGNFVVAWEDQSGLDDASVAGVRAQIFTPDGLKVGTDFPVNSTVSGYQGEVAVTALPGGGFVVAYTDASGDGSGGATRMRMFNQDGTPFGNDVVANATTAAGQPNPAIITLTNGRYAVFYEDYSKSADDPNNTVRGRIFKANGEPESDKDFLVPDTLSDGEKMRPVAATLADGKFVVAWVDKGGDAAACIKAQLFDADGSKIGSAFVVSSEGVVTDYPSIVALNDGGFAIAYTDMVSETVQVSTFTNMAAANGHIALNPTESWVPMIDTSLAVLPDGRIVVSWEEESDPDASGTIDDNATAQIIDPRGHAVALAGTDANDQYVGTRFADRLSGAYGSDRLWGGDDADVLDGGLGNDTLDGGAGADTVIFSGARADHAVTKEASGALRVTNSRTGEADIVSNVESFTFAGVTFSLADILATVVAAPTADPVTLTTAASFALPSWALNLIGAGKTNIALTGNALGNTIKANAGKNVLKGLAGNDKLWGGLGNDTLYGGTGKDVFVFSTKPNKKTNLDKIADFNVKDDTIWLDNKVFSKLGKGTELKPGKLNKAFFTIGDKAKDKNDYLIYDNKKGVLYYDVDGSGAKAMVEIATLKKGLKMTAADFMVI